MILILKLKAMKTLKQFLFVAPVILLFVLTGCLDGIIIRGNGIPGTETRYAQNFSQVTSSGSFIVHVSNSDEYEVIVTAETNILPYIETEVIGGVLRIWVKGLHNINPTRPMEVFISTPVLEGLKLSGSGEIVTDFFESNTMEIFISGSGFIESSVECHVFESNISGSGIVYVSGKTDNSDIRISGSGKIESYDMVAKDCKANISGSGDAYVNVLRLLDANISGSGSIFYIGTPDINTNVSGSGKIINDN